LTSRQDFLSVMNHRYACKLYDTGRKLASDDISYILECARLSPSSFGLEHWQLYAVSTPKKIAALKDACFAQDAVGTAALAVVAACRRGSAYEPGSDFITERGSRFPGGLDLFVEDYRGYYEYLAENGLIDHWARAQTYIACANMMNGAAVAGIDSCAIEGFDNEKVLSVLGLDPVIWQTGIITVFGYSAAEDDREKIRMPSSRIITHV